MDRKWLAPLIAVPMIFTVPQLFWQPVATGSTAAAFRVPQARWTQSVAFDISAALSDLAAVRVTPDSEDGDDEEDLREEHAPQPAADSGFAGDEAVQSTEPTSAIPSTSQNFEGIITNQSVEAAPGVAGVRWYEVRRTDGTYSVFQQGTFAPNDGVHRWMGSAALDWQGNVALGYSVVNGTNVFPGIRYTARLAGDPLGQMTVGEGVVINGTGVQRTTNSRWGDYSSLNVDPSDDCTFWYVNEYYTAAGQASSTAGWQTRIGTFQLPGCYAK